jgi:hypothetical protein
VRFIRSSFYVGGGRRIGQADQGRIAQVGAGGGEQIAQVLKQRVDLVRIQHGGLDQQDRRLTRHQ